jgi:hypothetical protein
MPLHLDVLGRLHSLWGIFGILTGASLGVLALGTDAALGDLGLTGPGGLAAVWLLAIVGGSLVLGGLVMVSIGRALARRRTGGRLLALLCAVPNLVLVPFGTALGIYTFWVLLNDDARRDFGRPPRSTPHLSEVESR